MKLNGDSGLELLTQLRGINPEVVAILMTGFAELQDTAREGVRECFLKPVDIDRLIETIG
jgi:ActR/RegA family two-component response regulator